MAIQSQIEYTFIGQKDQIRKHEFSKVDPKTGNTVTLIIEDNNNNGADYYDSAIVNGGDISIFKKDFANIAKKVGNGKGYNKNFKRQYHDPAKAGQIEITDCKEIKEGSRYTLGSIMKCMGLLPKSATGSVTNDADKTPKSASATPVRHHRAHSRHASAPTPEPAIEASVPPPEPAPQPAASATPQTPAPAPAEPPAPPAAVADPAPPAPVPTAAASKPAPAAPPAPDPAPPAPPKSEQPIRQPLYSYTPRNYTPAYSTGFDPSSILFGLMGGMGLMMALGGFGGGGFFGLGGGSFLGLGGYGFHHPHHFGEFAFHPHHFGGFEFHHPPRSSEYDFHYSPHFSGYGNSHHESFAFHHDSFSGGFGGHHGGFGGHYGGFGRGFHS